MRCPDCNKFVGNEIGDPELNIDVDLELDEGKPGAATVSGDCRLVLNCADCSTELAESTPDVSIEVPLEHVEADKHEVSLDDESAKATDRYDGKEGTPMRYRRHYYGADVSGTVTCSCGAKASFSETIEEQAGAFDQLN